MKFSPVSNDPSLRVLFLAWRDVHHPEAGGSELYVQRVAEQLVALGHEVTVRCAQPGGLPRAEDVRGVQHERVGGRLGVYPRGLLRAARSAPGTVIVDVINGVPFGAGLLPRKAVVGLVHHVHEAQWRLIYPGLVGSFGWWVESRLAPRSCLARDVVTVSEASRADLSGLGYPPQNLHVIRNGRPAPPHREEHAAHGQHDAMRLVLLARLVPHKQVEHALLALAALTPEFPTLRLDIVGDGWWRPTLEQRTDELGVRHQVTFHGHVEETAKTVLLQRSYLMLMPSAKEGWCLAVTEAGALGVPTIGYRSSGGLTESIRDGETGWLVDDLEGLIDATRIALSEPQRVSEAGAEARAFAWSLSWERAGLEFERVLLDAGRHRSP